MPKIRDTHTGTSHGGSGGSIPYPPKQCDCGNDAVIRSIRVNHRGRVVEGAAGEFATWKTDSNNRTLWDTVEMTRGDFLGWSVYCGSCVGGVTRHHNQPKTTDRIHNAYYIWNKKVVGVDLPSSIKGDENAMSIEEASEVVYEHWRRMEQTYGPDYPQFDDYVREVRETQKRSEVFNAGIEADQASSKAVQKEAASYRQQQQNDALDREMAERNGMTVERYRELLNKKLYQQSGLEGGQ